MKKMANFTAPYSILKPETSSDSPSEKSKGVRFNSATILTNQVNKIGKKNNPSKDFSLLIFLKDKNLIIEKILKIIKAILISYEIVCATPRIDPKKAYVLLEDHPLNKRG